MKKLNKIQINPQRIIDNQDLVKLRGGACEVEQGVSGISCFCSSPGGGGVYFVGCFSSDQECIDRCNYIWGY